MPVSKMGCRYLSRLAFWLGGNSKFVLLFSIPWLGGYFSCQSKTEIQVRQYYVQGEQLYLKHCSNCHQKSGKGLGLLYPPLAASDYLQSKKKSVFCLIRNGQTGELTVNGKNYNQAMPGFPLLTDLEIAEIATFIYNAWGNEGGHVDILQVGEALKNCGNSP